MGRRIISLDRTWLCLLLVLAAWVGNLLYAAGEIGGELKYWSPALVAAAMIAFLLAHGLRCYPARLLLSFVVTVFLIGWAFESLSLLTGFPFGNYHYTEVMKPFIGRVPVFVLPAYCVMGYVCWSMARILVGRLDERKDWVLVFVAPVIASMLMVVWDLSMDPLRATVERRWVWLDGGEHHGVPLENFVGWALVTWTMFQCFAVIVARDARHGEPTTDEGGRFWIAVPPMYLAFPVEYLLNPIFHGGADQVVSVSGRSVELGEVYTAVAMLTASTMLPLAVVAAIVVHRLVVGADPEGASHTVRTGTTELS